jgi:hypothetical protein
VEDEWGVKPLRIREGGVSVVSIYFSIEPWMLTSSLPLDDTLRPILGERIRLPRPSSPIRTKLRKPIQVIVSDLNLKLHLGTR